MSVSLKKLSESMTDEIRSRKAFSIGTYAVLALVSAVMTVLNIATDKGVLTYCTGAFSLLCIVNIVLTVISEKAENVAKIVFAAEVVVMFSFFLVSGNPEGFSAIWICMLPSLGMFFFDRLRGSIICAVMFLILVFFLWTPFGNGLLLYSGYTETFKTRFPILFIAFHLLAFFLETLRANAYKRMKELQDHYQKLSVIDTLTGVYNRQGMYSQLEKDPAYKNAEVTAVALFDIDFFKSVNDTYGHNMGDTVLKEISDIIKTHLSAVVCRWGGEEFVAVAYGEYVDVNALRRAKDAIEHHIFTCDGKEFNVTVSIGYCIEKNFPITELDTLIDKADDALYKAKNTGRNKIVRFDDITD